MSDARDDTLKTLLAQYGLSNLYQKAWDWMVVNETADGDLLRAWIEMTPEFNDRFPAIKQLRDANKPVVSASTYLELERTYSQIMKQSGLPRGFYDTPDDFSSFIAQDISPDEVAARVRQGFERVAQAPQSVRDTYTRYFGVQGDAAHAAFFLDPQRTEQQVIETATAANIGGAAFDYGIDVEADRALNAADRGISADEARQALGRLSGLGRLFNESVGEAGPDLSIEEEGFDAMVLGDGRAAEQLDRRVTARTNQGKGAGGAFMDRDGTGIGTAE